jgi:uncharacterized protein YndB with AHSA1/START domain
MSTDHGRTDPGFDPGPLADASVEPSGERWTLVFVRDLRHPPQRVWAALTEPAQLAEWAPFLADRGLDTVGEVTLTMVDGDHRVDLSGAVVRAEPPRLLEYSWDSDLLRWELDPVNGGTRLTLRHTLTDRTWVPKVAAGWHLCVVVAERLLDGSPVGPIRGSAARAYGWVELRDAYAAKLGIEPDESDEE